ncbi:uncharacterized protein LOC105219910 isoform X2 [Zeugodacus cucurbitae]|uniref:uncharacterized protein LOC105219910 isoform X2 n=1 Tax=Zeugodacus cucurbitae TaxID=28588 RepID=UPI0023D907CE|nr:uncharacterized protein LOC105219910 isoform X2 [Zeugodacus cucurbitae]
MLQHIFGLLAKLLICCNLITDATGITNAATNATTAAFTSMLTTTSQHINMPHNWLRRQRRYLLFEKGTTLGVQISCAKAIIPERPRGLYNIYELTLNYALPISVDDLWPKPRKSHPTTMMKTKAKQVAMTKHHAPTNVGAGHTQKLIKFGGSESNYNNNTTQEIWLSPWYATATDWPAAEKTMPTWWQVPARRRQWFSNARKQQQQQQYRKQYSVRQQQGFSTPLQQAKSFTFTPRQLSNKFSKLPVAAHLSPQLLAMCPRQDVYGGWQNNVPRLCAAAAKTFRGGRKGVGVVENVENNDDAGHQSVKRDADFHFATNAERIFFDLLAQWAHIYNYPPHYCIMRTFCESRYLLAARGQSLFHDLLRILIE